MANDEVLNKTRILRKDMPDATVDGKYVLRYRIISEDGLKTSQWSTLKTITAKTTTQLIGTNNVSKTVISDGVGITISWDTPSALGMDRFDVYAAWSTTSTVSDTPAFVSTVFGNRVYLAIPTGMTYFRAIVQLPTYPKQIVSDFQLLDTGSLATPATPIDGGIITLPA